jgi:glycine betaine transporter
LSAIRKPTSVRNYSFIAVGIFAVWGLVSPSAMTAAATGAVGFMLDSVGWLYLLLCSSFLVLAAFLALGPYGSLRLGPDDSRPDFSTLSWLSMLFAGGMGAGLVFWGVAEPVSHFAQPPGNTTASSPEAARLSMVLTALHWGLHPWAIYASCALVVAYFVFRRRMPGLISAPLRATLPRSAFTSVVGIVADVIGVFAVVFGLAGSLVMGVLQVRAGLWEVYGLVPTTTSSLVILAVVTIAFLVSASTGLDKGIQWLSNINMVLAIGLLLFVTLSGPTSYVMESFVNVLGDYTAALPSYAFRLLSYEDQMGWSSAWTLTYLVWWVAWGPFVGIFIARISRGRTIREFCGGVILVPAVFSLFWFAALGGTSLWIELSGGGGLSELVHEDTAKALFAFLSYLPQPQLVSTVAVLLVFIFLVTSADSATFVVSMMTSEGSLEPKRSLKLIWGGAIALITVAVLVSGSVEVAKAMAVFGAVPFTLILVFQIVAFLRALRTENRGGS